MGEVERVSASLSAKVLHQLTRLLAADDREAVLGDLAEDKAGPGRALLAVAGLLCRRAVLQRKFHLLSVEPAGATFAADADGAKPWPEWAVPLAFGLIAAACVVALLVPSQSHTLTWPGIFTRSAWLLLGAALAAVTTIFLVHRGFREYLGRPGSTLIACAWSTAIWIPLLLLLWSQHALWVVLTPVPIAAILASFTKRRRDAFLESFDDGTHDPLPRRAETFSGKPLLLCQTPAPVSIACALLLDAACLSAAAGQLALTSSIVIVLTAILVWAFTPGSAPWPPPTAQRLTLPRSRTAILPCFLLTCLALTPFLRAGLGSGNLAAVVLAHPLAGMPQAVRVPGHVYSGVVLMAPPLPKRKLITSPPKALLGGVLRPVRPLMIPFDGAYWYFQDPETAPKPDARVTRGDPTRDHVHSSADWTPIKMEAHQRLGTRLSASCCQSLSVLLVNADNRHGLIEVEAKLRNISQSGTSSVSLGTVPLLSSAGSHIPLDRPRVNETLRFPLRGKASTVQFNEISLVFKLATERNLAGARVQVVNFTLQP